MKTENSTETAAASAPPVLSVCEVSHSYGAKLALDNVSFDIRPGRFTALLGPNGAGKSTLFSLLTRLNDPGSGAISIAGVNLAEAGSLALQPLGIVFQQPTLDLDLTVQQNLYYFGALRGLSHSETRERMMQALKALDMADRAGEKVRLLNGGHRRRVEIARALLHDPQLLLLDEPTVGLDSATRRAIVDHVHALAANEKVAVLWATHLMDETEDGDDLIVLNHGRVIAQGTTREVILDASADSLSEAFERLVSSEAAVQ